MEPAASSTDTPSYRAGAGNLSFAFNTQVRYWTVSGDAVDRLMTPDYYAWLSMRVWFDTAGTLCCSNNVSTAKFGWFKSTDYSNFPWVKLNNITYRPVPGTTVFVHDGSATSKMVIYLPRDIVVQWNANGGSWESHDSDTLNSTIRIDDPDYPVTMTGPDGATPQRRGYRFIGWAIAQNSDDVAKEVSVDYKTPDTTFYAQWERADHDLGFNVDSEPNDEDYKGEPKDDQTITGDRIEAGETVEIEDPKRPGYVFQGWVIPDAGGEHALDQDLVYQGGDGKWYVDASKLPDYAGDDGRIELTARWTSVISVDVPSSATFYYDLVTDQSAEAHEAALSGTTSFSSKSQVDLRICGLESKKAAGADSLFSSGADSALLSVYPVPSDKAQTVEGAQQGPAGAKPATAVDFSLDDIVLERAFTKEDADAYKIPAGDDLTLAYRLNLSDAAKLDYDRILAMAEGDEASLASLTYTLAADLPAGPFPTGSKEDPLWVENVDPSRGPVGVYGLTDIKTAADDLAQHAGSGSPQDSAYYALYNAFLEEGTPFHLKASEDDERQVELLGICQDARTKGGFAGLTFIFSNIYVKRAMGPTSWETSSLRAWLQQDFFGQLDRRMQDEATGIVPVTKAQQTGRTHSSILQITENETVFVPSCYEIWGYTLKNYWGSETSDNSFHYQRFEADPSSISKDGGAIWWTRSNYSSFDSFFSVTGSNSFARGDWEVLGVVPCFAL